MVSAAEYLRPAQLARLGYSRQVRRLGALLLSVGPAGRAAAMVGEHVAQVLSAGFIAVRIC